MTRIACIGEAMIELRLEPDGRSAAVGVSGDTLNTAIYLKRTAPEVDVDYITRLGQDSMSAQMLDFMAENRIGTDGVERSADRMPGLYAISTDATGERSFTYWRNSSAARQVFETEAGPDFSALSQYDMVYLSAISLAIMSAETRNALITWLQTFPGKVAFDSNHRPALWESVEASRTAVLAMWARADVALPTEDDEMALFGEDSATVRARFAAGSQTSGALKCGPQGPLSLDGQEVVQDYPSAPKVVDTTAAGDSFNGAYLAATLTGRPQNEALRAGHDCAAEVVQHKGAIIDIS